MLSSEAVFAFKSGGKNSWRRVTKVMNDLHHRCALILPFPEGPSGQNRHIVIALAIKGAAARSGRALSDNTPIFTPVPSLHPQALGSPPGDISRLVTEPMKKARDYGGIEQRN